MVDRTEGFRETQGDPGLLTGLVVLDLTDLLGQYCGKLLADLGAEVIKVEPRAGAGARSIGPFKDGVPGPERSLFFAYYNTNKMSLTLNLDKVEGRALFKRLAATADVVVEDLPPGRLAALGLGYDALRTLKPGLVMASITGFGQWGPYSDYVATSSVVFAASGLMAPIGDPDGPPTAAAGNLSFDLASIDAASGILCALFHRDRTGDGQHVEVAALEVLASEHVPGPERARPRTGSLHTGLAPSGVYACRDGQVEFTVVMPHHWRALKELLGNPQELEDPSWDERSFRRAHVAELAAVVARGLRDRNLRETVERAQALDLPCLPVNSVGQFTADPQIRARGFFVHAMHPVLGDFRMPGQPYQLAYGAWRLRSPAPLLGQHNEAIFGGRLGLSHDELGALRADGAI